MLTVVKVKYVLLNMIMAEIMAIRLGRTIIRPLILRRWTSMKFDLRKIVQA